MGWLDYVWLGIRSVFQRPEPVSLGPFPVSVTLAMILAGILVGVAVGATPGRAGPMAMAIALPILISIFGFTPDALLPAMGFLIGVIKGATIGGALPAILFNTPGTPDADMTTLDGYPMAQHGQAKKALRIAHFASASGATFCDLVLIFCAAFLAALVEAHLDLPEKTALPILSLAFIAAVIGGFNPGPSAFKLTTDTVNPEPVVVFGRFTAMMLANLLNWTIGGRFMRATGVMIRVPKHILLPVVLPLTLTAIDGQQTRMDALWFTIGFGVLSDAMRRLGISPLPFVIAFILGAKVDETARQAFAATGGDAFFLFTSPIALAFILLAVAVVFVSLRRKPEPGT